MLYSSLTDDILWFKISAYAFKLKKKVIRAVEKLQPNHVKLYMQKWRGAAVNICSQFKKVDLNLFYIKPFFVCCISQATPKAQDPFILTVFSSFQLRKLAISPRIALWVCYRVNYPFHSMLKDDNVMCHSKSREDNELTHPPKYAIHVCYLGKELLLFYLLTTVTPTIWARLTICNISALRFESQTVLTSPSKTQVRCSSEAMSLFSVA